MNIGFAEARKLDEFDCYFFHDVDLILENDDAIYHCRTNPLHYSAYINIWNYAPPSELYSTIYGGVTAFKPEAFQVKYKRKPFSKPIVKYVTLYFIFRQSMVIATSTGDGEVKTTIYTNE